MREKHRTLSIAAFALVLCLSGLPLSGEAAPLSQPALQGADVRALPAANARPSRRGSRPVVVSEAPLSEEWTLSAELSRACSVHAFVQRRDRFLIARLGNRVYGAAVGGHGSLVDAGGLGTPGVVYVFQGQGSTRCHVYHRQK